MARDFVKWTQEYWCWSDGVEELGEVVASLNQKSKLPSVSRQGSECPKCLERSAEQLSGLALQQERFLSFVEKQFEALKIMNEQAYWCSGSSN